MALINTLCQIYALYSKCEIPFLLFFFNEKMGLMCVIITLCLVIILWVPLAHNRALPLLNLIFPKLIDNIIIYYIIIETITSYITTYSYKNKIKNKK